jgi:hypothetical protein
MTAFRVYRDYLRPLDDEACRITDDEEYVDLLTPDEVIDLLCTRDKLATMSLNPEEQSEVSDLDDVLVKHHRIVVENIPPFPDKPRSHWWWHLHEGPQVRREAEAPDMKRAS